MDRKIVSGLVLIMLVGVLTSAFNIQQLEASGTIYIRPDRSVDPPTAPIHRNGTTYTFIGDIKDSIVVEKSDIVIDGAGHVLEGMATGKGISLSNIGNVTIKNMTIKTFDEGIYLERSSSCTFCGNSIAMSFSFGFHILESSSISIEGNNVSLNNICGILLEKSSGNTVSENHIIKNEVGVTLEGSSRNDVSGNTIRTNYAGIDAFSMSSYNNFSGNNIADNTYGIAFSRSSNNNTICHNNLLNNVNQAYVQGSVNLWDDGSSGNYWSDYEGEAKNGNGIGDIPYIIDLNNIDRYPLIKPWTPPLVTGPIYIRADGSIDPPDAPISTVDNVTYTLTDNIYGSIGVGRDNIVVDGADYTVEGTMAYSSKGIYVYGRNNVTIKNLQVQKFPEGIYVNNSTYCRIQGDTLTNNFIGIHILWSSNNNIISGNVFVNDGLLSGYSYENTIVDNLVNGKPLVYLENQSDYVVENAGQVVLINCTNITVKNLNLSHTAAGVQLWCTNNTNIAKNNITNNWFGILMDYSSNNTMQQNNIANNGWGVFQQSGGYFNSIRGNTITNNTGGIVLYSSLFNYIQGNNITYNEYGITLAASSNNSIQGNNIARHQVAIYLSGYPSYNNVIYHNNFIDNIKQVYEELIPIVPPPKPPISVWDDSYPSGGNYWSDYTGVDEKSGPNQDQLGSDGIGDTPYVIDANNQDRYPLMKPWTQLPEYRLAEWIESPNYTPAEARNITYIVIHVMDGYFEGTIEEFKNNASGKSAHYLISQKGKIVQMVREKDIAWHAGNWEYNQRSIGIEHEDKRNWDKPNWAAEELYQSSASLVRYLCDKYGIPKDRVHIIGHNEDPGVTKPCPGPYWDWDYFMGLVKDIPTPRKSIAVWENKDYPVLILSNSTVSHFTFNQPQKQIRFNLTGLSGTKGYGNVTIPKNLRCHHCNCCVLYTQTSRDTTRKSHVVQQPSQFKFTFSLLVGVFFVLGLNRLFKGVFN